MSTSTELGEELHRLCEGSAMRRGNFYEIKELLEGLPENTTSAVVNTYYVNESHVSVIDLICAAPSRTAILLFIRLSSMLIAHADQFLNY